MNRTVPTMLATMMLTMTLAAGAHAGDKPEQREERGALREQLRGRVQEKIGTWLTTEITTKVGLDATKSAKLSEAIKAHMQRKGERMKKLREEMEKLRTLVNAGGKNDAALKTQLDTVIGLSSRDDDVHELLHDTAAFMSVQEQAKLALAMPEIMKELRHMMKEAKHEMRGKRGPQGGFGGRAPDDDDDEL